MARASASDNRRIAFLDGLRGLAIIWVILFHAYVRWPDIVPYGSRFAGFPLFAYGWLGVQLFFLISGFVIFMTLEKTRSLSSFIVKRWLRLFPAMFLCSVLIYLTAPMFVERPAGIPILRDLLPGLTFMEPQWWSAILNSPQGVLEGAFWSLFVEVKFYLIAGTLYFLVGGNRMIQILISLFLLAVMSSFISKHFSGLQLGILPQAIALISAKYFGWFAAGALYYRYFKEGRGAFLGWAVAVAAVAALNQEGYQWRPDVVAGLVVLGFTIAVVSRRVQKILSAQPLVFFGFASYPLYLLHENMLVSLIAKLAAAAPSIPDSVVPVLPILFVAGIAWPIARFAEPQLRRRLAVLVVGRGRVD